MHYSPGAPILRSYDLAHWEYIGHAVPTLADWGTKYDLTGGQRAYVKGIWASTMRYRPRNGLWYWMGCVEFGTTYVYTAPAVTGPWRLASKMDTCLYDCGLLIDDDDAMYVAYGKTQLHVARLSADGLRIASTKQVYSAPSSVGTLEGSRLYKRAGRYYIATDHPATQQYVLQASSPQGSYAAKMLANAAASPVAGSGNPHQGSLVDTPTGDWYYLAFIDAYPGGRLPVLAPLTWGTDGFPSLKTSGGWAASYPYPAAPHPLPATTGTDTFAGRSLSPAWEWNHTPDASRFALGDDGLRLSTATVMTDLYAARNTLTRRIHGPSGAGIVEMDMSGMADGDVAELALFRDRSGYIGVARAGRAYSLNVVTGINMNSDWATTSNGTVAYSVGISSTKVWLRISASIAPGAAHTATFSYSTDGSNFTTVGPTFTMTTAWQFFMGYRYGIFNYATKALGGSIQVSSFTSV